MAKETSIACPNCKFKGVGKNITKGSFCIELILWLSFLVPGLIYTIWRLSNKKVICPKCGYEYVVREAKI